MSVPYWVLLCPPSHQNRSTSFDLTGECASHGQTTEDPPIDWTLKLIRFFFFLKPAHVCQCTFAVWYTATDVCLWYYITVGHVGPFLIRIFSPSCGNLMLCEREYPAK